MGKIRIEDIKNDIIKVKNIFDSPPSTNQYGQYGKYGVSTVKRKFGSWNNALLECVGKINKNRDCKDVTKNCSNCNKSITIRDHQERKNNFCSKSCAAKFNGSLYPKRQLKKKCKSCDNLIFKKNTYCSSCICKGKHLRGGIFLDEKTIKDVANEKGSNRYNIIRHHARAKMKNSIQKCSVCGYSNHVEVCHINPISNFPIESKLKIVNSLDNLILLCPNHHWEHDNPKTLPNKVKKS